LHFVIVGAGPTGVEISSVLSDLSHKPFARLYPHVKKHIRISIPDVAPNFLGGCDQHLRDYAMDSFYKRDVEVITESHDEKVDKGAIYTRELGRIPCNTVLWATSNGATALVDRLKCQKTKKGLHRLLNGGFLRLRGTIGEPIPDAYALGDADDVDGASLPTTAEVACQNAKRLGTALNKEFEEGRSTILSTDRQLLWHI
jgi:NADH:ubiquinone reductase (non-electrogenic)